MKAFLIYWILGCFIVGVPLGQSLAECPTRKVDTIDVVGWVATWPAGLFAAFALGGTHIPKPQCEK